MEQKKSLSPIIGTKKIFRIINKRIEIGTCTTNKSGKKYENVADNVATRESYRRLLDSIPAREGCLIMFGVNKFNKSNLGFVNCTENLRHKFSKSPDGGRLNELTTILKHGFDCIEIVLCKVTNK
jgi:hypothetical protein